MLLKSSRSFCALPAWIAVIFVAVAQDTTDDPAVDSALYSLTANEYNSWTEPSYTFSYSYPSTTDSSSDSYTSSLPHVGSGVGGILAFYVIIAIVGLIIHLIALYLILVKLYCGRVSRYTLRHPRRAKAEKAAADARGPTMPAQVPSKYANQSARTEKDPTPTETPDVQVTKADTTRIEAHGVPLANTTAQELGGVPIAKDGTSELSGTPMRDR